MTMRSFTKVLLSVLGTVFVMQSVMAQNTTTGAVKTDSPAIEASDIIFRIKDFKIQNLKYDDDFPAIQGVKGGGKLDWLLIRIDYEWKVDTKAVAKKRTKPVKQGDRSYWLDNVEFDWRVVLAQPTEGTSVKATSTKGSFNVSEDLAVRMKKVVTYADVSDDGERTALFFVETRALKRYIRRMATSIVFCDVRIKVNGRTVGRVNSQGEKYVFAAATDDDRAAKTAEKDRQQYIPRKSARDSSLFENEKVKSIDRAAKNRMETPWRWSREHSLETIVDKKKD